MFTGVILTMDGEVYHEGKIVAMAGESPEHNKTAGNVYVKLRLAFRGKSCEAYMENIRVHVAEGHYRYPDVVALCGEPQFGSTRPKTLLNPTVIFEVLSESTADKDTGIKFDEFTQLLTVTDYILIAQNKMRVRHYHRLTETKWEMQAYTKAEDVVRLEALDVSLTLADIYEEITFPKPPALAKPRTTRIPVRKKP